MRIHVNSGRWRGPATLVETAVRAALESAGDPEAEISVTLVGDDRMRGLNRTYLSEDRTTDVLSFSLGEEGQVLGDVYVSVPQARRQARESGVDVEEELVRLAVHGTLHVLGHDHPEGPERWQSPMFRRQEAIVHAVLSIGPPLPGPNARGRP